MLLQNKTAFITGGSRGIGKAVVERCLEEGANVYYFSRSICQQHKELLALAQSKNLKLEHLSGEVSKENEIHDAIKHAHASAGSLDILVNNAGITKDKLLIAMKKEDWDQVIDVNLNSIFYSTKAAVPIMLKQRSGSIINMSSIVGITGNPGQVNYAASKAGIIGFSKSLALEIAKKNVRVNVIAPGFISTDMTDSIPEEYRLKLLEKIPINRIGHPKEIADTCIFLASEMSSYITGQVITVSGGLGG